MEHGQSPVLPEDPTPPATSETTAGDASWWVSHRSRAFALLGCVWLLLALVALLLSAFTEGTVLRGGTWYAGLSAKLHALETALMAGIVLCVGIVYVGVGERLPAGRAARRAVYAVGYLCLGTLLFAYYASWSTFRSTGMFLDYNGIVFMANDMVQFFQHVAHMESTTLWLVPLAAVLTTAAILAGLPRLVAGLARRGLLVTHGCVITGVVGCVVCLLIDPRTEAGSLGYVPHPVYGMGVTIKQYYLESQQDRTGPVLHAVGDVLDHLFPVALGLEADPRVPVVHRPQVSDEEWAASADAKTRKPWNVVFLIVESLRPDQLQILGGPREVMPTVDAMARESRLFSNHYAQASHSNYADLCPLSSHYPLRSDDQHFYPKNPRYPRVLIYDLLKQFGYRTAIISSQNENWGNMLQYLDTGNIDHLFHSLTFEGELHRPSMEEDFSLYMFGHNEKKSGKVDDRHTVNEAIRWMTKGGDEPFFLYLNLQNSHTPYVTPPDFPRKFGRPSLPFKIRYTMYPRESAHLVKDWYSDSLAYVDSQVARLVQAMQKAGIWDETIFVLTGDTGEAFFEHGFGAHGNRLFEEQVRVPLLFRAPGLAARMDDRPAQHIDVPPTILDLLGLPPHPGHQGISLLTPNPDMSRPRFMITQTSLAHDYAVEQSGYKFVFDARRGDHMFFNLRKDPMERVLCQDRARLAQLRALLATWVTAQLDYYRDADQQLRVYPPVLGSP